MPPDAAVQILDSHVLALLAVIVLWALGLDEPSW